MTHTREAGKISKRQAIETDIAAADQEPLPLELNTQAFRDSWNDWLLHRASLYRSNPAKRWTALAAKNTLTDCARHGAELSVMAITAAISNGWQGLVWDRLQIPNGQRPVSQPREAPKSFAQIDREAKDAARHGSERLALKVLTLEDLQPV